MAQFRHDHFRHDHHHPVVQYMTAAKPEIVKFHIQDKSLCISASRQCIFEIPMDVHAFLDSSEAIGLYVV